MDLCTKRLIYVMRIVVNREIRLFSILFLVLKRILRKVCLKCQHMYRHMYSSSEIGVTAKTVDSFQNSVSKNSFLSYARINFDDIHLIQKADETIEDGVTLLGVHFSKEAGPKEQAKTFNFLKDPVTDFVWRTDVYYLNAREGVPTGSDIKCPWELSRCYHMVLLGEAYSRTQDEKYAKEYYNLISSWVASNPFPYGPNWNCTMEVGIRIANWLVALLYFRTSPSLDERFYRCLLISARQHGMHIIANLENLGLFSSNHYVANIAGLYLLGIICPVLDKSRYWRFFAKKELEKEIFRVTFNDGWEFEFSTAYHRLVLEMFYYSYVAGETAGDCFSSGYKDRLVEMAKCMAAVTKPNGKIPQVGDNDSGRFLIFDWSSEVSSLDTSYILKWNLPGDIGRSPKEKKESVYYEQAGLCVLKSKSFYLMITAARKSKYRRNSHAHNDVLGIELNVLGKDIFVDPGTFTYTRDLAKRNRFRSIANHNTLHWPGIEPNILEHDPFLFIENGDLTIERVELGGKIEEFSARYAYNNRFHHRHILFDKAAEEITINDTCSHIGAQATFICGSEIHPEMSNESLKAGPIVVTFEGCEKVDIGSGFYSPSYGVEVPVAKITVHLGSSRQLKTKIQISR